MLLRTTRLLPAIYIICGSLLTLKAQNSVKHSAQSPPIQYKNPKDVPLVTTDLAHFHELLEALPTTNDTAAAIQQIYLDRASPALSLYITKFRIDAKTFAKAIGDRPAFYNSFSSLETKVRAVEPEIRDAIIGWKRIYPDVVYPPIYFFVGTQRAGGLTRKIGIFISADMYIADGKTPLGELKRPGSIHPIKELPYLIAHELSHYEQFTIQGLEKYEQLYTKPTLLGIAIREGSADFLAKLASGGHINSAAHLYGLQHEHMLWKMFRKDMLSDVFGDWLFKKPSDKEWPQDLGYFIGFRITESFYNKYRENNTNTVKKILSVTNYKEFLSQSGYDGGL